MTIVWGLVYYSGALHIGHIRPGAKGHVDVRLLNGVRKSVPSDRVVPDLSITASSEEIPATREKLEELLAGYLQEEARIQELYDLVRSEPLPDGGGWALPELLAFLVDDMRSMDGMCSSVCIDRATDYFTRSGTRYTPLPYEQNQKRLLARQHAVEKRARQEAVFASAQKVVLAALVDGKTLARDEETRAFLDPLYEAVVHPDTLEDISSLPRVLEAIRDHWEDAPKDPVSLSEQALVGLGVLTPYDPMGIERYAIARGVPSEITDAAQEASAAYRTKASPRYYDSTRIDLRDLDTVTIDDASTQDMDDAISVVQPSPGEYRVYVHIADVASVIEPGSVLDRYAAGRGASLYAMDQYIPMLPQDLSSDVLSLRAGEDRRCITCEITLREDGTLRMPRYTQAGYAYGRDSTMTPKRIAMVTRSCGRCFPTRTRPEKSWPDGGLKEALSRCTRYKGIMKYYPIGAYPSVPTPTPPRPTCSSGNA